MLVIDNCYKSLQPFYTNISCFNGRNHTLNNMKVSNIVDWIAFCFTLQIYQQSLKDGKHLNAVIALLEQTSRLISTFNNKKSIKTKADPRLNALKEISSYFATFGSQPGKNSFTKQCLQDLQCCITGTLELIDRILSRGEVVNLGYINSDVVENHFCQVRTLYNGANNNPNYYTYRSIQNSVVITQPKSLPGKRNASTYLSPAKRKLC